jgi:hypothetical protein
MRCPLRRSSLLLLGPHKIPPRSDRKTRRHCAPRISIAEPNGRIQVTRPSRAATSRTQHEPGRVPVPTPSWCAQWKSPREPGARYIYAPAPAPEQRKHQILPSQLSNQVHKSIVHTPSVSFHVAWYAATAVITQQSSRRPDVRAVSRFLTSHIHKRPSNNSKPHTPSSPYLLRDLPQPRSQPRSTTSPSPCFSSGTAACGNGSHHRCRPGCCWRKGRGGESE